MVLPYPLESELGYNPISRYKLEPIYQPLILSILTPQSALRFFENQKLHPCSWSRWKPPSIGGFFVQSLILRVESLLVLGCLFWEVLSNIFYFHTYLGKIPILTNIFQMGWNHQLVFWCRIDLLIPFVPWWFLCKISSRPNRPVCWEPPLQKCPENWGLGWCYPDVWEIYT